jgi:hypothetical protein
MLRRDVLRMKPSECGEFGIVDMRVCKNGMGNVNEDILEWISHRSSVNGHR